MSCYRCLLRLDITQALLVVTTSARLQSSLGAFLSVHKPGHLCSDCCWANRGLKRAVNILRWPSRLQSSLAAEVDITRIGLWGTSFAGGHVLVTAAKEGTNVTAVVSQVCDVGTVLTASSWLCLPLCFSFGKSFALTSEYALPS